ncbi:MAG: Zn-dependent exopeptidase M28 [Bacteriovoracaceae bacterium]|jgi:hypothetical protein|nr:Zn-dependent exopeptidase M28 [Bacteriovoracaceae bacterium]
MKSLIIIFSIFYALTGLAEKASVDQLKNHLTYLTSRSLFGRTPGTPGHKLARDYITTQLKTIGMSDIHINQDRPRLYIPGRGRNWPDVYNIVAKYEGVGDHKSCIVYSAHYDHGDRKKKNFKPGAGDNGSGVVALLELARLLVKNAPALSADIYLTFPDQEENYIAGSPKLVKHLLKRCPKILFNVNLDLVGGKFFKGFENHILELTGGVSEDFSELIKTADKSGIQIISNAVYPIEPLGKTIPRSDYSSFRAKGIPFIFYTSGTPWYYHTTHDTIDKINFPFLANVVNRLYSLVDTYQISERGGADFSFNKNQKIEIDRDGLNFAGILKKYIAFKKENFITDKEASEFQSLIDNLENPKVKTRKRDIHKAVLKLIKSIGSKYGDYTKKP